MRIVGLLALGRLRVRDLSSILRQSQPRISRHLKILTDAGLIERVRAERLVYLQFSTHSNAVSLIEHIIAAIDPTDSQLRRDRTRAEAIMRSLGPLGHYYFSARLAREHRTSPSKMAKQTGVELSP